MASERVVLKLANERRSGIQRPRLRPGRRNVFSGLCDIRASRLTSKGNKTALLFVLFHKRVCGPLANSLFNSPPATELKPATRIEAAYRKADQSIQHVLQLLAA